MRGSKELGEKMVKTLDIVIYGFAVLWLIKWAAILSGLALCRVHVSMCVYRENRKTSSTAASKEALPEKAKGSSRLSYFLRGLKKYEINFISTIPSHFIRKKLLQYVFCMKLTKTTVIYKGLTVIDPWKISIGEGSIIGDDNILDGRGGLWIGNHVNLSSQVRIWTGEHDVQGKGFEYSGGAVRVGNRVWISGNVTVLPGITIGDGAVIASGAVVTGDVEPFAIYAGVPARKIGDRNGEIHYTFDGKHDWFC